MANSLRSSLPRLALYLFALILIISSGARASVGGDEIVGWMTSTSNGRCEGTIGECLDGEFEMDSESNRRILATTSYISYQALKADSTPSCGSGNSYYNNNCQSNQANPYNRPCAKQAGCRG
ncbi:protein RALF-like 1 [Punica granatum]|uniref:Uncharacterized protein n=2 Tax=Punica granatum TaxID=22663 RepID=A0A218VSK6_PUNGR|nr:protein RALF-like 1 [Punica granatum]OWM63534.1 hypothetical protein CDL15_Pgr019484 [Punica granatum]PKI62812.1 hypothetical protein CRG98_016763 [Punica granatum]